MVMVQVLLQTDILLFLILVCHVQRLRQQMFFYVGVVDILDYTSVVKNKTVKGLGGGDNNSAGHVDFTSGTWNNSSTAISSIKLNATTGNLAEYTNISIYGVN